MTEYTFEITVHAKAESDIKAVELANELARAADYLNVNVICCDEPVVLKTVNGHTASVDVDQPREGR